MHHKLLGIRRPANELTGLFQSLLKIDTHAVHLCDWFNLAGFFLRVKCRRVTHRMHFWVFSRSASSRLLCLIFLSKLDSSFAFSTFPNRPFSFWGYNLLAFYTPASEAQSCSSRQLKSEIWRVNWVISTLHLTNYTFCWWVENRARCTHTHQLQTWAGICAHSLDCILDCLLYFSF